MLSLSRIQLESVTVSKLKAQTPTESTKRAPSITTPGWRSEAKSMLLAHDAARDTLPELQNKISGQKFGQAKSERGKQNK